MKTIFINTGSAIITLVLGLMACSKTDIQIIPNVPGLTSIITYAPEFVTTNSVNLRGGVKMDVAGKLSETGVYLYAPGTPSFDSTGIPSYTSPNGSGIPEKIISSSVSEGDFYVYLSGLTPNTCYKYRAFASNEAGTFFGVEKVLITSYSIISDAEGNSYQTIMIGDQVWTRENLKSKLYTDKTCINGCYQLEDNPKYGNRYSWTAANKVAPGAKSGTFGGACPTGWHVPSDKEWQKLLTYIGISSDQFKDPINAIDLIGYDHAGMLKDASHWPNGRITNHTGFSVLPADICSASENVACVKTAFWTSSPGIFYGFQFESEKIVRGYNPSVENGFSVRCIKDLQ